MIELEASWDQFLVDAGVGGNWWRPREWVGTYTNVLRPKYSESHRAYHTFEHIEACLQLFKTHVPRGTPHRSSIELAIWFHDAVYDTASRDNEEQSVALMVIEASKLGLPESMVDVAIELILATKSHAPPPRPSDTLAYFLDIDMSILGSSPEVYEKYEKDIRTEYSWVPEDAFRAGRSKILKEFLNFDWIYNTSTFRRLYEGEARKNIKNALATNLAT